MPMSTPDGRLTIVYNGEVYNSRQLREELEARGYQFRSSSDTEVVLYLYNELGPASIRRLNGKFSLAIWDQLRHELFIARDHFGVKPLYYCHQRDRFAFASEIKSLLQLEGMPRRIDFNALDQYLTFLWVPDPLTMFEEILKLPAGHYAVYRDGDFTLQRYWDLDFPPEGHEFQSNEKELSTELRERFTRSVKAQLVSDVPVGAFLSAGLDSSSIVAAMANGNGTPLRTFTIAFPEKYRRGELTLDDTEVSKRTAQYFDCQHTEITVESSVVDLLPNLVWHMDEPVADPAIITAFLVNREARKTVTVLLSGVGGDELFAGYRKHLAHNLAQHYQRIPETVRSRIIEPFVQALPGMRGTAAKGYVRLAKKMARRGSLSYQDAFLMDSTYFTDNQKIDLYTTQIREKINGDHPWSRHREYFARISHAEFLNQLLYVDTKAFMVSLNLNYNDKMSMASSVEVRVPFLDWEFAEWVAWNVPPDLKLHGRTTKHILREAMRPVLPQEVLNQKKAGFGAPADYWLAYDLREMVDDLLSVSRINERQLFDAQVVRRLVEEQRAGIGDWSAHIWQLLTLELWMQTFLD